MWIRLSKKKVKKGAKGQEPKESSPSPEAIPEVIQVDITRGFYEEIKAKTVKDIHPLARGYIEDYFEYLQKLNPDDVIDAIEKGETVKSKYDAMPWFAERLVIAAARGFLKVAPEGIKGQARKAISIDTARVTIRFENPTVHKVIESFGKKGEEWLNTCIYDFREIIGINEVKK